MNIWIGPQPMRTFIRSIRRTLPTMGVFYPAVMRKPGERGLVCIGPEDLPCCKLPIHWHWTGGLKPNCVVPTSQNHQWCTVHPGATLCRPFFYLIRPDPWRKKSEKSFLGRPNSPASICFSSHLRDRVNVYLSMRPSLQMEAQVGPFPHALYRKTNAIAGAFPMVSMEMEETNGLKYNMDFIHSKRSCRIYHRMSVRPN